VIAVVVRDQVSNLAFELQIYRIAAALPDLPTKILGVTFVLTLNIERVLRRALILIAVAALALGGITWGFGRGGAAKWIWALGTLPVTAGLLIAMIRDFLAGRVGVDAIAFVSMLGALLLGETLAGVVVAIMYAGGNVLEDLAVARAERDLKSLVDRAQELPTVGPTLRSRTFPSSRFPLVTAY
jgi:cation transport ATPase